jgi:hypothetical protein
MSSEKTYSSTTPIVRLKTKAHADMLFELLSKAAATGEQAQTLADLYAECKLAKGDYGP